MSKGFVRLLSHLGGSMGLLTFVWKEKEAYEKSQDKNLSQILVSTTLQVHARCANVHNCFGLTLGN